MIPLGPKLKLLWSVYYVLADAFPCGWRKLPRGPIVIGFLGAVFL